MAFVVKKFGGSSVATPEKIYHLVDRVLGEKKPDDKIVIVVSAMGSQFGGTVFTHQAQALNIQPQPPGDNGNVDPFTAQVNPGVTDPVYLARLKAVHIDRFVKARIQADGCDHLLTPYWFILFIIPFRTCPCNRQII